MSKEEVRAAANLWAQVWNEGRLDLVSEALASSYIRHEPNGTRTVTMEQYREEIAAMQKKIPDINFTVHDEAITDDSANSVGGPRLRFKRVAPKPSPSGAPNFIVLS